MSSDDIQAKLAELAATIEEAKATFGPVENELALANAEERALKEAFDAQMAAMQKRKQEINGKSYKAWQVINEAADAKKKLEAEQKAAEEAALKAIEAEKAEADRLMAELEMLNRFESLMAGAPWRELAKEHQIEGAKRIVSDRNVILADPMGLGKTLTSIITCDLIEGATKFASEDEPVGGILKNIWVPGYHQWTQKAVDDGIASAVGKQNGYLDYDRKNKLRNEGHLEVIEGHYEDKIVDSVTRPVGRRVLYLCPSSLLRNVLDEWRMWAPHRSAVYIGNMSKAERDFVLVQTLPKLEEYVIICNYEAWRREKALVSKLIAADFDTIIIDEAHNAKDMKSLTYKGIARILEERRPEYVIPMTGTPVLNRPEELFTLLHMVNPEQFYRLNDFTLNYCMQDDDGHYYFKPGGLELLSKKISKNFMRRTKDQAGIKLPPKTVIYHDIEVDVEAYPAQAKVRKQMRDFAQVIVNEKQGKILSAAAEIAVLTRLRQIETWPAGIVQYQTSTDPITGNKIPVKDPLTGEKLIAMQIDVEESQKVDYVISKDEKGYWNGLIPEAIGDERMVLFSQFKAPLREIANRVTASGFKPVILDGSTSNDLKDEIRRDFDARHTPDRSGSKWDIVLCNYNVGGVGFNFTAASQLIALDETWNPGKRDQAFDRIDRMGQVRPTTVHVVRNKGTIDDWLSGIMERKEGIVDGLNSTMEKVNLKDFLDETNDSGLL